MNTREPKVNFYRKCHYPGCIGVISKFKSLHYKYCDEHSDPKTRRVSRAKPSSEKSPCVICKGPLGKYKMMICSDKCKKKAEIIRCKVNIKKRNIRRLEAKIAKYQKFIREIDYK